MDVSRRVIGFVNLAHLIDHLFMLLYPAAVLAMTEAFDRSYGDMLVLATGGFIAFGAGSLPSGWLGDRWSRRRMLVVFFVGIGAATVLTGLSTSIWMLALGLTLIGAFASIYHPVGMSLLVSHARREGRALGLNGVFGNLGVAFSALIVGGLVQALGWRAAFVVPGLLAIAAGLAFAGTVSEAQAAAPKRVKARVHGVPRAVVVQALSALALATLAGGLIFTATTTALPKLFDERLHFLDGAAGWIGLIVAVVYLVGAGAQLIIGHLLDRYPVKACLLPLALVQVPLLWWAAHAENGALLIAAAAWSFVIFGNVTLADTIVARYATQAWHARVYGLRYVLSFGVAACAVPLVAFLHGSGGFVVVLSVLAGIALLVLAGALIFPYRPEELAPATRPWSPAAR